MAGMGRSQAAGLGGKRRLVPEGRRLPCVSLYPQSLLRGGEHFLEARVLAERIEIRDRPRVSDLKSCC